MNFTNEQINISFSLLSFVRQLKVSLAVQWFQFNIKKFVLVEISVWLVSNAEVLTSFSSLPLISWREN